MRVRRYEPGTELTYQVRGLGDENVASVSLAIERFVGGGFAGQVYRVKVLRVDGGRIAGVEAGGVYAMKILIPPSGFSCLFRDALYWVGFQGPFQLQVNPAAARAGALWQKIIRRGAGIKFGDERAVVDIYGTFVDEQLGSCGELSEWVDGRTWRLEVDDRLDLLKLWCRGKAVDEERIGSPEYRAKRVYMREFVGLLHEMGAHEFARQYEWSTCKSQPNCLKRQTAIADCGLRTADSGRGVNPQSQAKLGGSVKAEGLGDGSGARAVRHRQAALDDATLCSTQSSAQEDPAAGLTAVDFRAGLALLPFLPMSPGDVKLILKGVGRGSLVQFDRGDLGQLERFVAAHKAEFADMQGMIAELKAAEAIYRDSVPDITHNHVRLLYNGRLWGTMLDSAVTGWRVRNLVDDRCAAILRRSRVLTLLFFLIGCIPLAGRTFQRMWGRPDWRRHYAAMLSSPRYLWRAFQARVAEKLIGWHHSGRVDAERALRLADQPWRFLGHLPLSILPAGLHRALTDWRFARDKVVNVLVRPVRLYFNAQLREQWLRDMLSEGRSKHMLSDDDAKTILQQLGEPFIQKYLKSLAVHVCTLPVTHVVATALAIIYVVTHPEMPRMQAWGIGLGIIALFQIVPLSPGSLTRGFYVVYLVVRERNFKDYNIAIFLAFFKYVGYLAFPIQMTYRYPVLARFMAAHWATEAVHVVPVFGEHGALLEHWVFRLFYNWPLTLRRRMRRRAETRASLPARYWHIGPCVLAAAAAFGLVGYAHVRRTGQMPSLRECWWLVVIVPLLCGSLITLGSRGAALSRRIAAAAMCGALTGAAATLLSVAMPQTGQPAGTFLIVALGVWRVFIFTILSAVGAAITELALPEPKQGTDQSTSSSQKSPSGLASRP
jgi:hypothetical protein